MNGNADKDNWNEKGVTEREWRRRG